MITDKRSSEDETLPSQAKKAKLEPEKYVIRKAFVLVIINEKFEDENIQDRKGAKVDKENIKKFCEGADFHVNEFSALKLDDTSLGTDDLEADEIKKIFKVISKGDFSFYDAFMCFTSSHGTSDGIVGVDGDLVTFTSLINCLTKCASLKGKPKLFFAQNCRGTLKKDFGIELKTRARETDDKTMTDYVKDVHHTVTIPAEADVLTAYSSVDGYESYRDPIEGSWFISNLTSVLTEHVNDMQLTDMLAMVSEKVARLKHHKGWKQMPCYTSTLRRSVVFATTDGQSK